MLQMILTRFQEMAGQFTAIHYASHHSCTPKMSGAEVKYLVPEWKVPQSHERSKPQLSKYTTEITCVPKK